MPPIAELLALPAFLFVSAWGALKILVDLIDRLNSIRNFALGIGKEASLVPASQRKQLFISDWFALAIGLAIALFIFMAVFWLIPVLYEELKTANTTNGLIMVLGKETCWKLTHLETACYAYALLGMFALVAHLCFAFLDCRLVFKELRKAIENSEPRSLD